MGVDALELELDFAPGDPGQIEQIIDQPRLQLHVPLNRFQVFGKFGGNFRRIVGKITRRRQSRSQRRPQLVTERSQKIVLGLVGLFGGDFCRFHPAISNLFGHIPGHF